MMLLLGILIGAIAGCFVPDRYQGWVRGAWAWAWGRVRTRAPASQSATAATFAAAKAATRPARKPIDWGKFGAALLNPRFWIFLIVALAVIGVLRFCSGGIDLPFVKDTPDELRAELKEERLQARIAEHERSVASRGTELAEQTLRDAARRAGIIDHANQDIANAVSQADFDALHSAYSDAYSGVWRGFGSEGEPDPSPRGSAPVRRPGGHSA